MANLPFHIGILVAHIEAAIERFSNIFGLTFAPIGEMKAEYHGAEEFEATMRATYSREGPPHIELVQGQGDGLFSLKRGEGLHHLGVWSSDYPTYVAGDPRRCLPVSVTVNLAPGDPNMWLSDPADIHGTRVEFVDERGRPSLEAWIQGRVPEH